MSATRYAELQFKWLRAPIREWSPGWNFAAPRARVTLG
jgi:hypothetical protein